MKKKLLIIIVIIFLILIAMLIKSGFTKRTDVVLTGYTLSEDGTKMKIYTTVSSSAGYVRDVKVKQGGDNLYLTFYSTFGFFNSDYKAKSQFEIELNPSCTEIYFYKGHGGYSLELQKNEEVNEWETMH